MVTKNATTKAAMVAATRVAAAATSKAATAAASKVASKATKVPPGDATMADKAAAEAAGALIIAVEAAKMA